MFGITIYYLYSGDHTKNINTLLWLFCCYKKVDKIIIHSIKNDVQRYTKKFNLDDVFTISPFSKNVKI